MGLTIKGLAEIRQRLAAVRPAEIMEQALAEQAERLAEAVRERLSDPAGAGPHDTPWVQTGALRDSIEATASGLEATIGSNDPAAAPQEMGTSRIPPRPFLAPAASEAGQAIAQAIGQRLASAFTGRGDDHSVDSDTTPSATTAAPEMRIAQRRTYPALTSMKGVQALVPAHQIGNFANRNDLFTRVANDGRPGNNRAQNKQVDDVVRILGLTPGQRRRLHLEIQNEDLGFSEILERAKDMFGD